MKLKYIILLLIFIPTIFLSQINKQPKLVVGIVVDQMRYDYLEKYYNDFDENGFKKLIRKGSNFTNCKINYIPTVTGAGHASVYTGTTPFFNGIIANDWKDRNSSEKINCCTSIRDYSIMEKNEGIDVNRSPEQLLSNTIGDQIKLSNYGKSKVISISLKDRGALLPAGKSADGAFWFNDKTGKFISSSYYYQGLPAWVSNYNISGKIDSYLENDWTLLRSPDVYSNLPEDNSPYEKDVFNEGRTSFPHTFNNVSKDQLFSKLTHTPYGNEIINDLVKEALKHENLGRGEFIDHLAISYSTPDKIGHDYGPQSYEVKDTYLRLDKQLADLINTLESQVGKDNFILFLTADHGAMENTQHLLDQNFDAGILENSNFYNDFLNFIEQKYTTTKIVKTRYSRNIYLDYNKIDSLSLDITEVEQTIKKYLLFRVPEIVEVQTRTDLEQMVSSRETKNYLLNGFNSKRSGDILYSLRPNYLNWEKRYGAQHGSRHEYDSHIPLIFYGLNIPSEMRNEEVYIVDIAATVCDLIGVIKPSNCIGKPLIGN